MVPLGYNYKQLNGSHFYQILTYKLLDSSQIYYTQKLDYYLTQVDWGGAVFTIAANRSINYHYDDTIFHCYLL